MNQPDNYAVLIEKINAFIQKYYFNNLLRGLIFLGAGLFSVYLLVTVTEYYGNFNTVLRTVLFYLFIGINAALIVWLIIPSLLAWLKVSKTLSHDEAAQIIGRHFSHVNDKLLNTLQLKKLALNDPRQQALIEAGIEQKIKELKPVSFPSAIDLKQNRRYLKWALIPFGALCIIAFAAPSILTESTKRLVKHNEYFAPIAPYQFKVLNSSLKAVQGDDLPLEIKLEGNNFPADVYIEVGGNTFRLEKKSVSRFSYQFKNLQQSTPFRLTANGIASQVYQVTVNNRPTLINFDVELQYPAYLHKAPEKLSNAGDLTLPAGTIVNWQIRTRYASQLSFNINENEHVLKVSNVDLFNHSEKVLKSTRYKITTSNENVTNADSSSYQITVVNDEAPAITVEQKEDSVSTKALYFTGNIQDDHGFSSLTFHYRIGNKVYSKPVKADLSQAQAGFFYFWDLKKLNIQPGDQVTYYFEVADNDGVSGPKISRSAERTLNVPDAKQLNEQLEAGSKAVQNKTESAIKLAAQIEKESQKLNKMLLDKNTLSFDEKKQVEQLLQKRMELNNLIKEIQDENKKNQYNRSENQQQSEEIKQKQQQIADLFNNVLDPKTQELLKKLQDMLEKGDKDDTRDELSKMQMDNKMLKKELDRVLELYKKLAFDQKVEQNINRLNELAEQQQKLSDQTQQQNKNTQELMQEQQKLQNEFNDVKESLKSLEEEDKASGDKMNFDKPEKDEQSVEQEMNNSKENLKKNDNKKASNSQKQAAQKMQQMAQKMQQQQQEGEESENNINAAQLRELLKSLLNSSFSQEKTMQALRNMNPGDPGYVALAQKQKDIKDNLKTAQDSLYALSRRVPQIQSAVNKEVEAINTNIEKALQSMGDRRSHEALRSQQYAMTAMNNLALMLSEALEQLQNAQGGGSGKGKKKQQSAGQLAKMQQQLNQNMQKMREQMKQQGNQGKSGQGQNGMSEQLARMARQQQMIREALQKLSQQENKDGKNGLGNLDKISKEMEQTETEIVNRKISEETIRRQQQIQARLLDAEKAEQQREQDNRRESNAGKDMPPGYVKALRDFQQQKNKQTEQIRTVSPAFNIYYKEKIKNYFELLNGK
ncbi:hypothetical protein EOD41_04800 [Mucilaginibacter limnophilus]|uniref:DUF4175 family protein n=1 Tax=Mucilaginibacter limnophilus TaxID=1932778 RepID=A0A3S2Y1I4_9SPHI|nr:DUF4175 family protein [Mucilaginibacter limnophilus]RVU01289.1 hypothetical protein EOD41_04800 [Mucilaginibacter limnophilus]